MQYQFSFNQVRLEDYVHECYNVETFKKIYKPIINPMNRANKEKE